MPEPEDTGDLAEVDERHQLDTDPDGPEHYGGDTGDLSDAPEGEARDLADEHEDEEEEG